MYILLLRPQYPVALSRTGDEKERKTEATSFCNLILEVTMLSLLLILLVTGQPSNSVKGNYISVGTPGGRRLGAILEVDYNHH